MPRQELNIIVCIDKARGIGFEGKIPWRDEEWVKLDRAVFRRHTLNHAVVMGKRTFEECGELAGRKNIVLGRDAHSLDEAIELAGGTLWVIGGASLYAEALTHPCLKICVITRIARKYKCDVFFPKFRGETKIHSSQQLAAGVSVEVHVARRKNPEESAYLDTLRELLSAPVEQNRTGIPAAILISRSFRFSLSRGDARVLPLLTTKKIIWRSVYYELMWFLRGCRSLDGKTYDTSYLLANSCHIWDDNTSRAALDRRGLRHYAVGECGPIYGAQWREWRPSPKAAEWDRGDISAQSRDQIAIAINTLRTNPQARDIVVSAWNPHQAPWMALPPCHYAFQFIVVGGRLSCVVSMRSGDMGLGVPFNIASYSLLTHLVSKVVGIPAGELIINVGNCHLYTNHFDCVGSWLQRKPIPFPTLEFSPRAEGAEIDDFHSKLTIDDLIIRRYYPEGMIKMPMAV
jgi:thymidylate synthase